MKFRNIVTGKVNDYKVLSVEGSKIRLIGEKGKFDKVYDGPNEIYQDLENV